MTDRPAFEADEWNLLVRVPRWIVRAASASQPDSARRTRLEIEDGFVAVANGRGLGSDLVRQIAQETMRIFDEPNAAPEAAGINPDVEAGLDAIIEQARTAHHLLRAKAPEDATVYANWLHNISHVVISAARSHDVLGIGGVYVTEREHAFDRRLATALAS